MKDTTNVNNKNIVVASCNVCSVGNKSAVLQEFINDKSVDVLAITETHREAQNDIYIRRITPPGFKSVDVPRQRNSDAASNESSVSRGGGVALVYKENMHAKVLCLDFRPTTFELLAVNLSISRNNVLFLVIYRPGSETLRKLFFSELTTVFEKLATYNCQIVVTGDFNIHLDVVSDPNTILLNELLQSFGLSQLVHESTHSKGHTLDVVITRSDLSVPIVTVDPCRLSDHHPLLFQLNLERPQVRLIDVDTRAWRGFNSEQFRNDLLASNLCLPPESYENCGVDDLQKMYDTTLSELMEKHAPKRKVKKRYQPSTPWFDSDCSSAKRKTRLYERCYKKSRSEADRLIWINQIRSMHKLYSEKQNSYWANKVRDSHSNSGKLWKTLSSILCRDKKASSGQSKVTADDFSRAFAAKVEKVRASTDSAPFRLSLMHHHCIGLTLLKRCHAKMPSDW